MELFKNFFHKYKDYILIGLLSLVPLLWYGLDSNMLMASNDVGSSMNPIEIVKARLFSWHSGINFGVTQTDVNGSLIYYSLEAFGTFLTGSIYTGQKLVVIIWFAAVMLSIYICLRKIPIFRDKPYMALLASLLFQFNHFQQHGWRVFWRTRFSSYILLPIMMVLLINYLEGKSKLLKTAIYMGIAVLLLNGGGSPPIYGANILLFLSIVFYYLITSLRNDFFTYLKRSIQFVFACGIVAFVMSSYWLFPYIYYTASSYSKTVSDIGGLSSMIMWTEVVSLNAGILNLLRNVGLPFWDTTLSDPKLFLTSPVFIALSFIWPVLLFSALLFLKKKEEKKYVLLFFIITIVALVFTAGSHTPFRDFYIFLLFHIPGFVIFRSPLYKFGNLLWFSYAVLIAFSLSSIIEKLNDHFDNKMNFTHISKFILPVFFILCILLWDYPIFGKQFLIWRPPLTTMLKIPSYVIDYGNWMNKQEDYSSRTLLLPELYRGMPVEAYRWGYWSFGSQLFTLLTTKNTITNDVHAYTFELEPEITAIGLDNIYTYLKNNDPNWYTLAKEFNIRYLVLRKDYYYDIDGTPSTQPILYEKNLSQDNRVEKIKTFGEWDIYRLKAEIPAKKIDIDTKPVFYIEKNNDILPYFSLISQKNGGSDKNTHFVSADNQLEGVENSDIIAVPGPMETFLPVKKGDMALPKPERLPGSPFYFTVENKEKEIISKAENIDSLLQIYINLTVNRLVEIKELIKINADRKIIEDTADKYIVLLDEIKKNIDILLNSNKDSSRSIIRTKGFLIEEKKLYKSWIEEFNEWPIRSVLEKKYKYLDNVINSIPATKEQEAILTGLITPYFNPYIVFLTPEYKWRTYQSGLYQVYINNMSVIHNNNQIIIHVDDQTVESQIDDSNKGDNWQKVGEINLDKGKHGLQINTDGIDLTSIKKGDIVFMKKNDHKDPSIVPEIVYRRINPTKYIGSAKSSGPTLIVLDEKFHQGWKLFIREKLSSQKDRPKSNIIDKMHAVLDESIFNTLFVKSIPEEKHIKVNSYANAWYFDPQKMIKGKEYEVIIEYWPQRLFYLFTFITLTAVCGSVIYLVKSRKSN